MQQDLLLMVTDQKSKEDYDFIVSKLVFGI
jgi:hypothetical protein